MKTHQGIDGVNHSRGSAVIVVIALVGLLLVFVAANLRSISHFGNELKLLETRQTRRLQLPPATTNAVPAAKGAEKSSI